MVGIFWFLPDLSDLFYVDKTNLQFAQKYGDWLISEEDHSHVWEKLKQGNYLQYLPKKYIEEYWKLPRGKVSYNTSLDKYYVYHGNWFLKKHATIIKEEFELPADKIVYEEDEHYHI